MGAVTLFGSYVSFQFLATQYLQSLGPVRAVHRARVPAGVRGGGALSTRMARCSAGSAPAPLSAVAFSCLVSPTRCSCGLRPPGLPDGDAADNPAARARRSARPLLAQRGRDRGGPRCGAGLAASLFQTSFQVGGAMVLAVVTAVVDAGGAGRISSPEAALAAYRPALVLITGVAAIGTLVALSGLRNPRALPDRAGGRAPARRGPGCSRAKPSPGIASAAAQGARGSRRVPPEFAEGTVPAASTPGPPRPSGGRR